MRSGSSCALAQVNDSEKQNEKTPWRGVEPRSRAISWIDRRVYYPIYYQGLQRLDLSALYYLVGPNLRPVRINRSSCHCQWQESFHVSDLSPGSVDSI